ncbi:MAG: AtpZ/AtpI family protein [Firmicutes bacterium]|nr:AtpZ/AtpI family protein [Bacillota bacterium]
MANKKNWTKYARYLNLAFSIGISMTLAILLGVFGGDWLDRRMGTSPLFLLLCIFLGIGAGFYNLWSELSKLAEIEKAQKLQEEKQHKETMNHCQIKEKEQP